MKQLLTVEETSRVLQQLGINYSPSGTNYFLKSQGVKLEHMHSGRSVYSQMVNIVSLSNALQARYGFTDTQVRQATVSI